MKIGNFKHEMNAFYSEGEVYDYAMMELQDGDFLVCRIRDQFGIEKLTKVYMLKAWPVCLEGGSDENRQLHRFNNESDNEKMHKTCCELASSYFLGN